MVLYFLLLGMFVLDASVCHDVSSPPSSSSCSVPKCSYSDLSLDSALATFLCVPEDLASRMEEHHKMSLLIDKIAPHLNIDREKLLEKTSIELVELVNLVNYGRKLNKNGHKKSAEQYMHALMRDSASAKLHKPMGSVDDKDLVLYLGASPILLLLSICPVPSHTDASGREGRNSGGSCSGYSCWSGECIPGSWVCDGNQECDDGTDEMGCPQGSEYCGEYNCHSGECLYSEFVCDGTEDCKDGTDEQGCPEEDQSKFKSIFDWFY